MNQLCNLPLSVAIAWAGFVQALSAQVVDVPVTLTLDPPAASAPGVNNLRINLDGGIIGSDSDASQISGTAEAIVRLRIDDPDNPVIQGIQFVSGNIILQDVAFKLSVFLISNIDISGTGISGTVFTPSGKPEPVSANSFDATLHAIQVNEGTLVATGTSILGAVNETLDLSVDPIMGAGSGTGTTSITTTASTPISYTYEIGGSVPVFFQDTIPVAGGLINIDATIDGTFAATGQLTIVILPELTPIGPAAGGFELELSGKTGAQVILSASQDLKEWVDIDNITLTQPVQPYIDPDALLYPRRYYRLREP